MDIIKNYITFLFAKIQIMTLMIYDLFLLYFYAYARLL